jgi:uncharacterized protein (DUF608 family)
MADVTSSFLLESYELYLWTGNLTFLQQYYPTIQAAADWQIGIAKKYGLPSYIIDTYDILGLNAYELATFNAAFHLVSMRACIALATIMNDTTSIAKCQHSFDVGRATLYDNLWTGTYFRAFNGADAVMADSFFAQVWAYTLGLGNVTNENDLMYDQH